MCWYEGIMICKKTKQNKKQPCEWVCDITQALLLDLEIQFFKWSSDASGSEIDPCPTSKFTKDQVEVSKWSGACRTLPEAISTPKQPFNAGNRPCCGPGRGKQTLILSFKAEKMDFITACHSRMKRYEMGYVWDGVILT